MAPINDYYYYTVSGLLLTLGSLLFSGSRKHVLLSLIYLELGAMSVFLLLLSSTFGGAGEGLNLLYLMIFIVVESVLGLSMLISVSRARGREYSNTHTLTSW